MSVSRLSLSLSLFLSLSLIEFRFMIFLDVHMYMRHEKPYKSSFMQLIIQAIDQSFVSRPSLWYTSLYIHTVFSVSVFCSCPQAYNKFCFFSSVAILQYICMKYKLESHWYPLDDTVTHARVQEYLNWQHANTRYNGTMLFRILVSGRNQF